MLEAQFPKVVLKEHFTPSGFEACREPWQRLGLHCLLELTTLLQGPPSATLTQSCSRGTLLHPCLPESGQREMRFPGESGLEERIDLTAGKAKTFILKLPLVLFSFSLHPCRLQEARRCHEIHSSGPPPVSCLCMGEADS